MPARPALAVAALVVLPLATACSSGGSGSGGSGSASTLTVTAGDGTCTVAPATVKPGQVTVTATYTGANTAEVYLYGKDGNAFSKVVGEVEDLTSGVSKSFNADVSAGAYEVACKAGGADIRASLTVTG